MSDRRMEANRRDDTDFEITFKDVDGAVIDINGATVFFTVKEDLRDDDDDAILQKEITYFDKPEEGIAIITLTKEEMDIPPKAYYFDLNKQKNH